MTESIRQRDALQEDLTDLRDRMDDKFDTANEALRGIERALGRLEKS